MSGMLEGKGAVVTGVGGIGRQAAVLFAGEGARVVVTDIAEAAKHGIVGLTKTAAIEYAPHIHVNCIVPGYIDTNLLKDAMARKGAKVRAKIPFRELGTPKDIAEMACWLSSDRARYASGDVFTVEGVFSAN